VSVGGEERDGEVGSKFLLISTTMDSSLDLCANFFAEK